MKRFLFSLIIVLSIISITGCNKKNKEYKIAVLIPGTGNYFVATENGTNRAAKEYNAKLMYFNAGWDADEQLKQINEAIEKEVDIIALCAVNAEKIIPGIKKANEAGVPILTFTNAVGTDESGTIDGVVSYVGQNEVKTGELCASIAKKLLDGEEGRIVCIEGREGTFCQVFRRQGFLEGIADTNMKVVYTTSANWNQAQAIKCMEDIMESDIEFNFVFCQDDSMAAGVGLALENNGLKDKVKVIGIGGSIEGLQALKDGLIDGNTYLSAEQEGYITIETCVRYLDGEIVDKNTEITQVEVNKDTVNDFNGEW